MIEEIRAKIKGAMEDPSTIANFRVMQRLVTRLCTELNYSAGFATQVVMSISLKLEDDQETEDLAVELLGDAIVLADKIARTLAGDSCPSAVLAAARNMDFSM